jgi:hypothetical protein
MAKIDFKKELSHLYNPSKKVFSIVDVPSMRFLMIDGHGDPNTTPVYQEAVEALYGVAYGLKFMSKKEKGIDYVVPPLEGLWWMEDMAEFSLEAKDDWDWTMMIMQPEWITAEMIEQVRADVARKTDPPALPKLRFEEYHEGLAVQILYIGPYADEASTIARMHAFATAEGYELRAKHHEIYLSDPRRTAPEKLKTVIRQPIQRQG